MLNGESVWNAINPDLFCGATLQEDAVKQSNRSLIVAAAIIMMAFVLSACVRPAPGSEDFEAATATPAGLAPLPTQPGDLVLPQMSPTPLGEIPTATPLPEVAQPTADPATGQATAVPQGVVTLPTTHTVQTGETLFSISQVYGVPEAEIQIANTIADPNNLTVGQVLTIPAPGTTAPPTAVPGQEQTYVVQPGDNLFRIGLRYGFTAAELAAYNGIPNMTLIYPGQVIRIPPR